MAKADMVGVYSRQGMMCTMYEVFGFCCFFGVI